MSIKPFKPNEELEQRVTNLVIPMLTSLGIDHDNFWNGANTCFLLGDVLYDLDRDPMAGVITRGIFRTSFFAIHNLFTAPGTFEFYLAVFRAIFGEDVVVEFEIPSPGVLLIDIDSLSTGTFNLLAREIVGGVYVYHELVTSDAGDFIMGQGTNGIKTQQEMDALINEISMAHIYTVCNLTT